MPLIPPETVTQLKKIDLLSYLNQTAPDELKKVGNFYFTRTHDSLCISENGLWHWQSRGIGGNNALKYLMEVRGLSFYDALCELRSHNLNPTFPHAQGKPKEEKPLILPTQHTNNRSVINYLVERRGIHPAVVDYCIKNHLLYEGIEKDSKGRENHNVVFVSYDAEAIARYAFIRGTGQKRYARDAEGSDKSYSFHIAAIEAGSTLIKTEAAIDVLSLASLAYSENPATWLDNHYLSGGGASNAPLERYLKVHQNIEGIDFCNDNDTRGREMTQRQIQLYEGRGYRITDQPPPIMDKSSKDYNDYLIQIRGRGRSKKHPALSRKMAR